MFSSKNIHEQPTGRRRFEQARRVQLIIAGMTDRFVADQTNLSEHFRPGIPGQIGAVVFRPYEPSPHLVDDGRVGYDSDGSYHCVLLPPSEPVVKTELDRWNHQTNGSA